MVTDDVPLPWGMSGANMNEIERDADFPKIGKMVIAGKRVRVPDNQGHR